MASKSEENLLKIFRKFPNSLILDQRIREIVNCKSLNL